MRAPLALTAALAFAACASPDDGFVDYRLFAMGTWVDVTLPAAAIEQHADLIAGIEAELRAFERDYYAWSDGELAALNRALTEGRPFAASDDMTALLETARRIAAASGGAFDPGIGALVERWGFHASDAATGPPPTSAEIGELLAASGSLADIVISGNEIRGNGRRFVLDLGGIAKGYAVDKLVDELAARGIASALVNAGGDLRVLGARGERPWRIGIQAPRGDELLGAIVLPPGQAAFTSGDYERFAEIDGQRAHHIIDPRSGRPAVHTQAVTVVASDAVLADAAATALFVAGPDDWQRTADRLGIAAVLRVDASGRIEMTPAMRDLFQVNAALESDILVLGI
ncbi:MAG: FAD:protein FMN transferase [Gammaproteobacteria bacterium]|nr:FAD:protein FMN transferase [Gammaproteobacteria bacterium]